MLWSHFLRHGLSGEAFFKGAVLWPAHARYLFLRQLLDQGLAFLACDQKFRRTRRRYRFAPSGPYGRYVSHEMNRSIYSTLDGVLVHRRATPRPYSQQSLFTFFRLIRSLVDPTLAAFIVCGPLQFLLLPVLSFLVPIVHLSGKRHCENKLSFLRTQHNVPGHVSSPDCSIHVHRSKY